MSYEGHIQLLCTKGHPGNLPVTYDMYGDDGVSEWRCRGWVNNKLCNEPVGWSNGVDDTNCESHGHHEMIRLTGCTETSNVARAKRSRALPAQSRFLPATRMS